MTKKGTQMPIGNEDAEPQPHELVKTTLNQFLIYRTFQWQDRNQDQEGSTKQNELIAKLRKNTRSLTQLISPANNSENDALLSFAITKYLEPFIDKNASKTTNNQLINSEENSSTMQQLEKQINYIQTTISSFFSSQGEHYGKQQGIMQIPLPHNKLASTILATEAKRIEIDYQYGTVAKRTPNHIFQSTITHNELLISLNKTGKRLTPTELMELEHAPAESTNLFSLN